MTPTQSATCLAAVFHGVDHPLHLESFPIPTPASGEAVVEIECCTICGSDLHTITGKRIEPTPSILGHEILGIVQSIGSTNLVDVNGETLNVGDRVTWSTCISCGACERCLSGLPQKCHHIAKYGHDVAEGRAALSGGLAEYILLRPGTSIVKVPQSISSKVICPVNCATATVMAAYRMAGDVVGKRVLIFGAGMLGLTAIAVAKSRGAKQVAVCDLDTRRLDQAREFGCDEAVTWHDDVHELKTSLLDGEFDIVLELSGSPDAVEMACQLAAIGGQIVLVGSVMSSRDVTFNPEQIVRRWLSIRGVHNYAPQDLVTAVEFLEQHSEYYPFENLVERSFPLTQVNEAVAFASEHRPVRVAIHPDNEVEQ